MPVHRFVCIDQSSKAGNILTFISTLLSNFAGKEAHNIQMSLCNLPVWVCDMTDGTITLGFIPKLKTGTCPSLLSSTVSTILCL